MRTRCVVILLVALFLPLYAHASATSQAQQPGSSDARPRIGLALGGGGARGGAHVGVIEILEELRIPIDYIAGTSIGAIIGGLYAAGLSPQQLRTEIGQIDWVKVFDDRPARWRLPYRRKEDDWFNYTALELGISRKGFRAPAGFVVARNLNFLLSSLTLHNADTDDFDGLPIPFRALATELATGEGVVIDHGSLAEAMRASMAIPGALTPVEWNGRLLVDGGFSQNLPVETVRQMGADIVIAVNVSPVFAEGRPEDWSLVQIGRQTIGMMMIDNTDRSKADLTDNDILVEPELGDIDLVSFPRMGEAIDIGRKSVRSLWNALSHLSVSEENYAQYLKRQRRSLVGSDSFIVDHVDITPGNRVPEKVVKRHLEIEPGDRIDLNTLERNLERVYQIGEFEEVGFRLQRIDGANRLLIDAKEKDTGPNYLRFGMRIRSAPDGSTNFSLLFYHRWAFVNRLGAEWLNRLDVGDTGQFISDFYQPLIPAGWLFVASRIQALDENLFLYYEDGRRDVLEHSMAFAQLAAGIQISNFLQLQGGVRGGKRRTELRSLTDSEEFLGVGEWFARLSLDGLDSVGFPTLGASLRIDGRLSRTDIHADENYDRVWGRASLAGSLWKNTLAVIAEGGSDFNSRVPVYDEFRAGGFLRLSGLEEGERAGGAMALATAALYRRVGSLPEVLGRGVYLGLSGEIGNAWRSPGDADIHDLLISGSVFFGLDSGLGPFYVAYGISEGGSSAFHLLLDPLFPRVRFF